MIFKWLFTMSLAHAKASVLGLRVNENLSRNYLFKARHKGERCFILGSGHSIKQQDLTRLKGEIVMTQNHFHAHQDIEQINPRYHVVVPKYQTSEYDKDWNEWFETMHERLPNDVIYFFGVNTKELVDRFGRFSDNAHYIETGLHAPFMNKAPVNITKTIMAVPTVLTECLAIAIYMEFSEIYLMGFDLDQICRMHDRDNVRFYGNSPITNNCSERSFEENASGTGIGWLERWNMWRQLLLLKDAAERHNVKIINATAGGLLDMYPRQDFDCIDGL